ncbi:MAG TPA: hypothetical protein VFR58_03790 [Flavisolibacter sp.]|nr:hypothetical protein [Flavisolibacter sp.]
MDVLEIDMIAGIGFLIFQPILGLIVSLITIVICLVAGLPIRLVKRIREFWISNPFLPVIGAIAGLILLVLSFNSSFAELNEVALGPETIEKETPDTMLSLIGWFLTAFSLLHFYPRALIRLIRAKQKSNETGHAAGEA